MLSNMAGTGEYTVNEVLTAMINREGPIFIEATRRAGIEFGVGAMGSSIGVPTKAYPPGEEHLRGLRDDYQQAWADYEAGDPEAVNRFYQQHPEYEARLALFRKPEERLRRFLVDNLWDQWNDMPTLNRNEVKEHLGPTFKEAFLDKETRNYDAIDLDEMQYWLMIMGGDPPGKVSYASGRTPLELTDPDVAKRLDVYYKFRNQMFDYYNSVVPLQKEYFDIEEWQDRKTFREANPVLPDYWDWRRDFIVNNPDLAPYIEDDPERLQEILKQGPTVDPRQNMLAQQNWNKIITNKGGIALLDLIMDYNRFGEPLPPAASEMLDEIAEDMRIPRSALEFIAP
jgi:hypothetical protein